MTEEIVHRQMRPGEEPAVCDLVRRIFDACIADEFEEAGATEFFRFANPKAMKARMGSKVWCPLRDSNPDSREGNGF